MSAPRRCDPQAIFELADGALSPERAREVRYHLQACPDYRKLYENYSCASPRNYSHYCDEEVGKLCRRRPGRRGQQGSGGPDAHLPGTTRIPSLRNTKKPSRARSVY